jgi:hypothetical protein
MLRRFERYALLTILSDCTHGMRSVNALLGCKLRRGDCGAAILFSEQYRSFGYFVSWGNRIYEEQGGELSAARRTKVSLKEGPLLSRNWLDKSNMART